MASSESRVELLRPPYEPVWLDLGMVYPVPEDAPHTESQGRDVQSEVRAEVTMRDVTTTGHTLLYVRYDAPIPGPAYARTAQWVLAWTVRPRDDGQSLLDVHTSPPGPRQER